MPPPQQKKKKIQKQASLLSFFGGGKEVKKVHGCDGDDDGNDTEHRSLSLSSGDDDEVEGDSDRVNIVSSSSSSSSSPPSSVVEARSSMNDKSESQCHHSSSSSPDKSNDEDEVGAALLVAVSPTGSIGIQPPENIDTTTAISSMHDNKSENDDCITNRNAATDMHKAVEDDDSSTVSSSSDEGNDENDILAHNNNAGKSAYELLREKNIARNNARLKELGLFVGVEAMKSSNRCMKQSRQPPKRDRTNIEQRILPARRSRRLEKNATTSTTATTFDDGMMDLSGSNPPSVELEETKVQESELFSVSPLLEYQMTMTQHNEELSSTTSNTFNDAQGEYKGITSLVPSNSRLIPPSGLNAIYSLQYYSNQHLSGRHVNDGHSSSSWLVGAGKSGIIALWDCSKNNKKGCEYIDPVISWKGHGGRWIADARFLPPPTCGDSDGGCSTEASSVVPSRLLTAGNDGTVCHWDLTSTSVKTGMPKLLKQSSKTLHASGIFSMDISSCLTSTPSFLNNIRIVTGSKDKTVAVSSLDRLDDRPLWRSDFHRAKVGSVNFSSVFAHGDIPLIASASDDGLVAIHDARISGSNNCVVAKLEDSHFKPHSAVWMPGSDTIFMTGEFLSTS